MQNCDSHSVPADEFWVAVACFLCSSLGKGFCNAAASESRQGYLAHGETGVIGK